jgi:hypothetical protein
VDRFTQSRIDQIETLKMILIARATGKGNSEATYQQLRDELLSDPELADLIPRFVRLCRSLDDFWEFIRPNTNPL